MQIGKRGRKESRRRQNTPASTPGSNRRKVEAMLRALIARLARSEIAISLRRAVAWIGPKTRSQNASHIDPISRKIDHLTHPCFQPACSQEKEQGEECVRDGEEKLDMPGFKEMIDE